MQNSDYVSTKINKLLDSYYCETLALSDFEHVFAAVISFLENVALELIDEANELKEILFDAFFGKNSFLGLISNEVESEVDAFILRVDYFCNSFGSSTISDDEDDTRDIDWSDYAPSYGSYSDASDFDFDDNNDLTTSRIPTVNYSKQIAEFVRTSQSLATKDVIRKAFPSMPINAIYQATLETPLVNMNGYYAHMESLNLSPSEIAAWGDALSGIINDKRTHHSREIYTRIMPKMSGVFSRIGITHYSQMFYISQKLFSDKYVFSRPYISPIGVQITSVDEQLINKVYEEGLLSIAELGVYARQISNGISNYLVFVDEQDEILFLNREQIITKEALGIVESEYSNIDKILDDFVNPVVKYRPLDEFSEYYYLPEIDYRWNEWLLYSIVRLYSKKYSVATSTNVLATARPYIVQKGFNPKNIVFDSDYNPTASHEEEDFLDMLDFDDLEDFE